MTFALNVLLIYFCLTFQSSSSSQRIDNFETETEVNHIPLQALNSIGM